MRGFENTWQHTYLEVRREDPLCEMLQQGSKGLVADVFCASVEGCQPPS